jgi:hypothetical protein
MQCYFNWITVGEGGNFHLIGKVPCSIGCGKKFAFTNYLCGKKKSKSKRNYIN